MLQREISVSDLPPGTTLSLKLNRASGANTESWQVSGAGTLRTEGSDRYLEIVANGTSIVTGTWQ